MTISVERQETDAKVLIDGNIDSAASQDLTLALSELMQWPEVRHVALDLRTVYTITSSAIGKLINFYKYLEERDGSMRIVSISDNLREQFYEIHLDHVIPINKQEE